MCRWIVGAAVLAAAVSVAGCESDKSPGGGVPIEMTVEPAPDDDRDLRDAFIEAHKGAAWWSSVSSVRLDDADVVVRTKLAEGETTKALEICEAAYEVARSSGVSFQTVTVRSADDSTLAHRNESTGDVACQ